MPEKVLEGSCEKQWLTEPGGKEADGSAYSSFPDLKATEEEENLKNTKHKSPKTEIFL